MVNVNVALVLPERTTTVAGTDAVVKFEFKFTKVPPDGAIELIVTVPVAEEPPITEAGLSVNVVSVGALIVSQALTVFEPELAEIITADWALTA